jgi:8-oxo-dGTP pyrophosphatase MutT (NUDIX family)
MNAVASRLLPIFGHYSNKPLHNFCCTLTLLQYRASRILAGGRSMASLRTAKSLPLQVAAVCYRKRGAEVEFLLVNTNGGNKWTFPKGSPEQRLSHSQAAEREAAEEAGALGTIEPRHFHLYIHSKGVFWQPGGVQEFVVKAFLMEVHQLRRPDEAMRHPTWFSPEEARQRLVKGREVKYVHELESVIARALDRIQSDGQILNKTPEVRNTRAAAHS